MKVVHYMNQFFGGLGGEEVAGTDLQVKDEPIGPGRLLEQVLGGDSKVIKTLICGDNYAAENLTELSQEVIKVIREAGAELFVAGPSFEAGRYGVAAAGLCAAVQAELGIPVVTGMAVENPGVDLYRSEVYIVDSGQNVGAMREVLTKMSAIAQKLAADGGESIGNPTDEGYIPQGVLRDEFVEKTAAERLVDMVLAKTKGDPYTSELTVTSFTPPPAPAAIVDMSKARIAIVTDGGLVPKGNPDDISPIASTNWGSYDISRLDDLEGEDYQVQHRGFDTRFVEQDPDRLVPVDVLREMEKSGQVGKIHDVFLSTSGLANPIANSRRLGREMAEELKNDGVDAVILTST
jgi:glycine reductase